MTFLLDKPGYIPACISKPIKNLEQHKMGMLAQDSRLKSMSLESIEATGAIVFNNQHE